MVIVALGALAFVVRPWQHDTALSIPTSTPTPASPTIGFEAMRDFVTAYYADLPTHPNDAWARLDAHCQEQTGQRQFLDFWATIASVKIETIAPRDATSVTARLTYVRRNGGIATEDRWLRMSTIGGSLFLDESERVGQVAAPSEAPVVTSPPPSATQIINAVAVVGGRPANGYVEGESPSNVNEVFGCGSSPAAVNDGIYFCGPSAADADVCYPSTPGSLLCVGNPWDHQLHRAIYADALPTAPKTTEPLPFAILLDDGTRCRLRDGGAWGGRDDGLAGAYFCYGDNRVVLAGENTPAIDTAQAQWMVKLGPLGSNNQHFPAPEAHTVVKAWFAAR